MKVKVATKTRDFRVRLTFFVPKEFWWKTQTISSTPSIYQENASESETKLALAYRHDLTLDIIKALKICGFENGTFLKLRQEKTETLHYQAVL